MVNSISFAAFCMLTLAGSMASASPLVEGSDISAREPAANALFPVGSTGYGSGSYANPSLTCSAIGYMSSQPLKNIFNQLEGAVGSASTSFRRRDLIGGIGSIISALNPPSTSTVTTVTTTTTTTTTTATTTSSSTIITTSSSTSTTTSPTATTIPFYPFPIGTSAFDKAAGSIQAALQTANRQVQQQISSLGFSSSIEAGSDLVVLFDNIINFFNSVPSSNPIISTVQDAQSVDSALASFIRSLDNVTTQGFNVVAIGVSQEQGLSTAFKKLGFSQTRKALGI